MNTPQPQRIFYAPGRQDKGASLTGRVASLQPAPPPPDAGALQNSPTRKPKLAKTTVRTSVEVRAELERIVAKMNKENPDADYSLSHVGGSFLEKAIQGNVDMQYHALLKPIIAETIRAEMHFFFDRFLAIVARIAYQVSQIFHILIRVIALAPFIDEKTLHDIEDKSETSARTHITQRTPQVDEVIGRLKQEMESKN